MNLDKVQVDVSPEKAKEWDEIFRHRGAKLAFHRKYNISRSHLHGVLKTHRAPLGTIKKIDAFVEKFNAAVNV